MTSFVLSSDMAAEGSEDLSGNGEMDNQEGELGDSEAFVAPNPENQASEEADGTMMEAVEATAPYTMPVVEGDEEDEGELPVDFDRLWKVAHDNPQDFTSWTDLLQYCEQEGHMTASRRALNAFLLRYPLCYGYWKKFADMERRAGNNVKAEEVCVQGLKAIPLSVDLWIHYINLLLGTLNMNLPESTQRIRSVLEEALEAAGMDWHSDRLWDLFAEWEKEQGNLKAMTVVYDRALKVPTQLYRGHYDKMKTHINSNPPLDILSEEEYQTLRAEYKQSQAQGEGSNPTEEEEERPPGEEEPADNDDGKDSEEAVQKMQELLLAGREKIFQENEAEVRKRWTFEDAIKRPYFHVKPLDKAQLKGWQSYLDWEMAEAKGEHEGTEGAEVTEGTEGTEEAAAEVEQEAPEAPKAEGGISGHKRVLILFERCLIACALYEEFWTKYAHYMEQSSVEEARTVFRRTCEIHLPYKHSVHLHWATFEERHGNFTVAQNILETLEQTMPGLAVVRLRRAGLERRLGHVDRAETMLTEAVEQSKENPPLHAFYSIKLARLLLKLGKNASRARTVLQEAIELNPDNGKLHLNLLELEVSGDPRTNGTGVQQCVTRALAAPLSPRTKILFSQRGLQFAEDFGATVQSVLTMYDEHQKLLKEIGPKKRGAENGDSDDPEKVSRTDDGSATAAAQTAPPTVPPAPMTAPPPPMMGDMSGSYGSYSSWYQQPQYGGYGGYQNPWNQYNQYYPPS
ncbi:pre-mRNA-processing factor 39 [Clupea harengus]|uniref:Pre-mRNA-processing factor 39 n=1 Tax=Clupea harengus TaxID=7950 RepID=A0A6P3WDW8_CLUHA|nr:pre-mRNA-processing factor 39 [Clupea harengus]